jgi:predicted transport protein
MDINPKILLPLKRAIPHADLYEQFKSAILNLADGIEIVPLKFWQNFDKGNLTLVSVAIQKLE